MRAMILAAGRGERMRPLTDTTPKALLSVRGRPLIEWHLLRLAQAGVDRVVVNLAWLGEQIRQQLSDGRRFGLHIDYSEEPEGALETAGGILRALPLLGTQPFWVINADIWTDYQPQPDVTLATGDLARIVLTHNPPHNPAGDFTLHDGRAGNAGEARLTYTGIGLYHPELFQGLASGPAPLGPLLRAAADKGRLAAEVHAGIWSDVGTPQRLAALQV